MSQEYEGWQLDAGPAYKALAIFLGVLLTIVIGSALFYNHRYAAQTRPDPRRFPAPRLELIDSAPADADPLPPPSAPAGIDRAMAATAAKGDALWNG
jgi:hypothetical protein